MFTITHKTAKLAKEKGFNYPVPAFYKYKKICTNFIYSGSDEECYATAESFNENWNDKGKKTLCSAPTQALLQQWLREKDIHVEVISYKFKGEILKSLPRSFKYSVDTKLKRFWSNSFNTYEDALEEGLIHALTLL